MLVEVNTEDVQDLEVLPEGEYKLQITSVEVKDNKAGTGSNLVMRFEVDPEAHPMAADIYTYLGLPNNSDTPKDRIKKQGRIARVCQAFGYREPQLDTDRLVGRTAWGRLTIEQDDKGENRNVLQTNSLTPSR